MKSQYEASPEELTRREEIAGLEEEADMVRGAWDAWSDFNAALHSLNPPTELVAVWDRFKPWLNSRAETIVATIDAMKG